MLNDCNTHIHCQARITLVGDLTLHSGFVTHLWALAHILNHLLIDFVCVDCLNPTLSPNLIETTEFLTHYVRSCDTDIIIFCCGIFSLHQIFNDIFTDVVKKHTCIFYGNWEFPDFPAPCLNTFKHIDFFWMPSKFSQKCFQAITHQAFQLIPIACSLPQVPLIDRSKFGIPESSFTFLFTGIYWLFKVGFYHIIIIAYAGTHSFKSPKNVIKI